jgi:hypothetical protein
MKVVKTKKGDLIKVTNEKANEIVENGHGAFSTKGALKRYNNQMSQMNARNAKFIQNNIAMQSRVAAINKAKNMMAELDGHNENEVVLIKDSSEEA